MARKLTSNINIDDKLVNGLLDTVTEFKYLNNAVSVFYVKFNNDSAGLVARQLDAAAGQHHLVPTKKIWSIFWPL